MAIVTKQLAAFDNGNVRLEIDYDDATSLLRAVRCINNSAQPCAYRATHLATGRSASGTFGANRTASITIPTSAAARMQITIDSRGPGRRRRVSIVLAGIGARYGLRLSRIDISR